MINKLFLIVFVFVALSACGDPGDAIDDDFVFGKVLSCTGLSASKPEINFINDAIWPLGDTAAVYQPPGLILVKASYADNYDVLAHEYIHHLLFINEGNLDACHSSSLFEKCAPTTAAKSC